MLKITSHFMKSFLPYASQRFTLSNGSVLDGKKLRVITLDALKTLIRLEQSPGNIYADFAKRHNIHCDSITLDEAFRRNFKSLSKRKLCYGYQKDGDVAWWIELVKNCFTDIGKNSAEIDELAHELFVHYGSTKPWQLVDSEVHNHLEELQRRGIRLGIISNFDKRLRSILDNFKLSSYFDVMFLSGEIGVEKPNKQIFEKAAKYFQINDMEEMLHVGDDEEKDFNGAKKAGARAILLNANKVEHDNRKYVICSLSEIVKKLEQ